MLMKMSSLGFRATYCFSTRILSNSTLVCQIFFMDIFSKELLFLALKVKCSESEVSNSGGLLKAQMKAWELICLRDLNFGISEVPHQNTLRVGGSAK